MIKDLHGFASEISSFKNMQWHQKLTNFATTTQFWVNILSIASICLGGNFIYNNRDYIKGAPLIAFGVVVLGITFNKAKKYYEFLKNGAR